MIRFFKISFIFSLLITSVPSYSNEVFPFKIGSNQVLNYEQTRALSILNSLLSATFKSAKVKRYTIEYETNRIQNEILKFKKTKIIFNNNPTAVLLDKELFNLLTRKLIAKALKITTNELQNQNVDWILTALHRHFKLLITQKFIPLRASFPVVHYMVISGINLNPEIIIESELYNSTGFEYELYSEMCSILLNTILDQENGKKIITDYMKSTIIEKNQPAIETLYHVLKSNLKYGSNKLEIEKHFFDQLNKSALHYSVNLFMPASAEFTLEKFKKINQIEYKLKDNSTVTKTCTLNNITENIDSMKQPVQRIRGIRAELNKVYEYTPYFMKKSLYDISQDLLNLTDIINKNSFEDKSKKIQLAIKHSIKKLYKEAEKQKILNKTLFLCEIKNVSIADGFNKHLKIIDKSREYDKNLYPQLNKYLDKLDEMYK
jgi:hypothetical protein